MISLLCWFFNRFKIKQSRRIYGSNTHENRASLKATSFLEQWLAAGKWKVDCTGSFPYRATRIQATNTILIV
jgi:hypothetical protein